MMTLRAPPLRAANLIGDLLLRSQQIRRSLFSVEALLSSAERRTGLTDWGDERFLESLRVLVDSFEEEVKLHPVGRWFFMRRVVLEKLVNRLLIQRDLERHPEIRTVQIDRPIIITGLPRTGTTLLHRMMAQLPSVRTLQLWELLRPSPPPDWATYSTDPRRRLRRLPNAAKMVLGSVLRAQSSIHHSAAGEPEECTHLLMNTLATRYFGMFGWAERYFDWLEQQGLSWSYRFYLRQLQLLTWRCSRERLVLKAPIHLGHLEEVSQVFPDACIVLTHRDAGSVLASTCSMVAHFRGFFHSRVSPVEIGQQVVTVVTSHLHAAQQFRERYPSARLLDVQYRDLIRDPVGTLEQIGEAFDLGLTASCLAKVRAYLASGTHRRWGPHLYDLETYGLTPKDVDRIFAPYRTSPEGR